METSSLLIAGLGLLVLALLLPTAVVIQRRHRSKQPSWSGYTRDIEVLARACEAILASSGDPQEVADIAYVETARLMEADVFQIGLFEGDRYRTLLWIVDGKKVDNRRFELQPEREGLIGWLRQNGESFLIDDFGETRDLPSRVFSPDEQRPPRSGIFGPLKLGEQVVGAISVQCRRSAAFKPHHQHMLSVMGNSIASALGLLSVQTEVGYRTRQLVLVNEVSQRLLSLRPLPDLFEEVAHLISAAYDNCPVRIVRRLDDRFEIVGSANLETAESAASLQVEFGQLAEEISSGELLLGSHGKAFIPVAKSDIQAPVESLIAPLIAEDRVLGFLDVRCFAEQPLSQDQIDQFDSIAAQLAMAILRAQIVDKQQEENWITTVLLEVARHAAQPGDANQALQSVLQLTNLVTGAAWTALLLADARGTSLRMGASAGLTRQADLSLSEMRFEPSTFGLQPPFSDFTATPRTLEDPALVEMLGTSDISVLPLGDGASLLGALIVGDPGITGRQGSLLAGIAHQISLRIENLRLIEVAAARRSLERELEMARSIQESFLPDLLPSHEGWELGVTWRVAREVSGDFYDFIPLPSGPNGPRWGIVIADVTDKGAPAALYMAVCRTLLRSVAISRVEPGTTIERFNSLLINDTKAELFVSVLYLLWEPASCRLTYANAGHNPPILFTPEQRPHTLKDHGMVSGVLPDEPYDTYEVEMTPGQLLVLYTDGVTEAMNSDGEMFGVHRLENMVLGVRDWSAQHVADTIADRVIEFTGEPDLSDDLTALVLACTRHPQ